MSFKDMIQGVVGAVTSGTADPAEAARQQARADEWAAALPRNAVPGFVSERLRHTAVGKLPWVSTASPADLLTAHTHGMETLGMVAGNCWFHFGYSWTEGHRDGWHTAIARLQHEAALMGAHAVIEVRMRTRTGEADGASAGGASMDYSVTGTAITIKGFPDQRVPLVATVSQLEFARLIEAGVLPVGLAVGADYDWFTDIYGQADGAGSWWNMELSDLSIFQHRVRYNALANLRDDAQRQRGTGVLGRVQFTEMFRQEGDERTPKRFLCRHIAFGTVVQHRRGQHQSLNLRPVLLLGGTGTRPLEAAESVI
jgi:uncharacterized protein YbjQ (UPF0145 family)